VNTTSIAPVRGRPGRRKGSGKLAGAGSEWGLRAVQALADPSRWRIVRELAASSGTLGDLAARVDLSAACTSHHVSILKEVGLVTTSRDARTVRCELATGSGDAVRLLELVLEDRVLPNLSNRPQTRPATGAPELEVAASRRKDIEEFLF
jgi:DNA-binding transcriptional ArsR family regulator